MNESFTTTEFIAWACATGLFLLGCIAGVLIARRAQWLALHDAEDQRERESTERTELYRKHCERIQRGMNRET